MFEVVYLSFMALPHGVECYIQNSMWCRGYLLHKASRGKTHDFTAQCW